MRDDVYGRAHEREYDRYQERNASRERDRDRDRADRRRRKSYDDGYDRDYDRSYDRNRDYDREWDRDRDRDRDRERERVRYDPGPSAPSQYVILRQLDPDTTEVEIQEALTGLGAAFENVRLMRDRDTGRARPDAASVLASESRRFAFVRLPSLELAISFVDKYYPRIRVHDTDVRVDFSNSNIADTDDWVCASCEFVNFKRRNECHRCHKYRGGGHTDDTINVLTALTVNDGAKDVSNTPYNLLLIRDMDPLTTEETVYNTFWQLSATLSSDCPPISQVRLIKDRLSMTSLGFAFLEYPDVKTASYIYNIVNAKEHYPTGFFLEDRPIRCTFAQPGSFVATFAPSQYTFFASTAAGATQILAYWDNACYPSTWPLLQLQAAPPPPTAPVAPTIGPLIPESILVNATKSKATEDEDLAAFYAAIEKDTATVAAIKATPAPTTQDHTSSPPANDNNPTQPIVKFAYYELLPIPLTENFLDRSQLQCLLCERQFITPKGMFRHATISALHKENLNSDITKQVAMFRKYKYKALIQASQLGADAGKVGKNRNGGGIGGKLLAKMGWQGGGLGKAGDGIVKPIEAVTYTPGAGIGAGMKLSGIDMANMTFAEKTRELARMRLNGMK